MNGYYINHDPSAQGITTIIPDHEGSDDRDVYNRTPVVAVFGALPFVREEMAEEILLLINKKYQETDEGS